MDLFENARYASGKIFGVVIGVVVDNVDPEGRYRVKVKFPWLMEAQGPYTDTPDEEDFVSSWARIATAMAGPDRGYFALPEVDDEVAVMFEHGDIRYPVIVGALWNGQDKPPHDNKAQDGKNNYRTFRSRSGHVLTFLDDEEGKTEKIILQTKRELSKVQTPEPKGSGGLYVVLDHTDGANKIEISDNDNKNYIRLDTTNNLITIETTDGDIQLLAKKGKILLDAKEIQTHSSSDTTVKADANYTMKAGSEAKQTSGSNHTIKGAKVLIN